LIGERGAETSFLEMAEIFISYRRGDSSAGRLFDALDGIFDVFYDVSKIDYGDSFSEVLEEELAQCRVFILVVSSEWSKKGNLKRLRDPKDWVRKEILAALGRGAAVRVVPVLIDRAPMPLETQLPEDLHPLRSRNAMHFGSDSWDRDLAALVSKLKGWLAGGAREAEARTPLRDRVPLLCGLCDRTPQVNGLAERLEKMGEGRSPIALVLAGHKDELHADFLDSLKLRKPLHHLLGLSGGDETICVRGVQWDPRDVKANGCQNALVRGVASSVMGDIGARQPQIQAYLRAIKQPCILYLELDYDCFKECGRELLRGFATAWSGLVADARGEAIACAYPVMLWLLVMFENDQQARKFRNELTSLEPLPELEPLIPLNVRDWIRAPEVKALLGDRSTQIEERLGAIRKLPMRAFVDRVREFFT
jgi:hypothetical protein